MQLSRTAMIAAVIGALTITSVNSAAARNRTGAVVAAGIAGLVVGGLIASHAYRPRYYYDPGPVYYYAPAPRYYAPPPAYYDPAIAYCMRRFRSYDPYSMTYLGYDGRRHFCP